MTDKTLKLISKSANKAEFKHLLEKSISDIPGSEEVKEVYKKALFKEIVKNPDYTTLPRITLDKQVRALEKKLLNKEHMDETDKENMLKSLDVLRKFNMYTIENLQKLDNAVSYTAKERIIGSIKFSRERFVPSNIDFMDEPNKHDVYKWNQRGIFKTIYNGASEYYFSPKSYIDQCKEQGKKAIKNEDIRTAMKALPGDFNDNSSYFAGDVLGTILDMPMLGCVYADASWWHKDTYGYIWVAPSSDNETDIRAYSFKNNKGMLSHSVHSPKGNDTSRPCLYLTE